jgi:hypothetical protein
VSKGRTKQPKSYAARDDRQRDKDCQQQLPVRHRLRASDIRVIVPLVARTHHGVLQMSSSETISTIAIASPAIMAAVITASPLDA